MGVAKVPSPPAPVTLTPYPAWIPVAAALLGLAATLGTFHWLAGRNDTNQQRETDLAVAEVSRELGVGIDQRLAILDRMAGRVAVPDVSAVHWSVEAAVLLQDQASISALARLDDQGRARDVVVQPWVVEAASHAAISRRLATRARVLALPRDAARFLHFSAEGEGTGIQLLVASRSSPGAPGVVALIDADQFFERLVREDIAPHYGLEVRVAGTQVFERPAVDADPVERGQAFKLRHRGLEADVAIRPGRAALNPAERYARQAFLLAGLFATVLITILLSAYSRLHGARLEARRFQEELAQLNAGLEARVAERTLSLAAANQELESFAYSIAHDMRSPLRHMQGYAEELESSLAGRVDATEARMLAKLVSSAKRQGQLVDELLRYARIGTEPLAFSQVELGPLVADLVEEFQSGQTRAVEWHVGELPTVSAETNLVRRAMQNLLDNAVKFSAAKSAPRIDVSASTRPGGEIAIAIQDNGAGFRPEQAHRLFGIFERLHDERDFAGTGIGLASVRRIMQRLGGSVEAQGSPDAGARFTLVFPGT